MRTPAKIALRLCAAILPALSLVAVAPGTAHATETYRYDDGTMETSIHLDSFDGRDYAHVDFAAFPPGTTNGITSAKLWVYGKAAECDHEGGGAFVLVGSQSFEVARFDPCAVFPTTSFGWHAIDIPPANLRETGVTRVAIWDSDAPPFQYPWSLPPEPTSHNAHYAIDTSADVRSRASETTASGTTDIAGELMWYIELSGTKPSMTVSAGSLSYAAHAPGTTATRTVTVTSNGRDDLLPTVSLSGLQPGDYTIANDSCTGASLATNATCTFDVIHTRPTAGTSEAVVEIAAPDVATHSITLLGQITAGPPASAFTTPDGATLLPGDDVAGTVSSEASLTVEYVRFAPRTPGLPTSTVAATLSCNAYRTTCMWSTDTVRLPGIYTVTAYGVDSQGNEETPIAPITVTIV